MEGSLFSWLDYTIFGLMLGVSVLIGVYFGCFGKKQKSVNEYLFGGNNMKTIPVALSLLASSVSGITLVTIPAEVYSDGATNWLITFSVLIANVFAYYFTVPVFYELRVATVFQYLELRFNKAVRIISSTYYSVSMLLFMPFIIYVPCLTLSQATGLYLHVITIGMTSICVFYTMIGGIKAVVWSDFIQISITIVACIAIAIIGTIDAGGFNNVMKTSYNDGILNIFRMDPNPFIRSTFWTFLVGTTTYMFTLSSIQQALVQRFLSLPSRKEIKKSMIILVVGYGIVVTLSVYAGLVIYVTYYGCDPVQQKIISKPDQIFPYYIMDRIGYIPALPGLYIAGVFGAALSTLSTGLNTMAGVFYEDYIKNKLKNSDHAHIYLKCIVVTLGVFCIGMVFFIEKMGKIFSLFMIITSITNAPLLTIFILGLLIPTANSKGGIACIIGSTAAMMWLVIGSSLSKINLKMSKIYPDGINTCPVVNFTTNDVLVVNITEATPPQENDVFLLYKLSYMHYVNFGLIIGLFFGLIVSYITGPTNTATLNPILISPPLRRFLPKKPIPDLCEEKNMLEKL